MRVSNGAHDRTLNRADWGETTMEIDITSFFENAEPFEFSASRAERGENAGPETWANAVREGTDSPLLTTPEQIAALRRYVEDFGAWDAEEIVGWSDAECNALFIQLVSGDIRKAGLDNGEPNWEAYEADENNRGGLYRGGGGKVYYSLSR